MVLSRRPFTKAALLGPLYILAISMYSFIIMGKGTWGCFAISVSASTSKQRSVRLMRGRLQLGACFAIFADH